MEILRKENKTQTQLIALGMEDYNFTDTSQPTIIEQATSVLNILSQPKKGNNEFPLLWNEENLEAVRL